MTADTKPAGAMVLKGCPFCNGEPQLVCGGPGNWYVRCLQCKAAGDDATRDRAAELWNTRALPTEAGVGPAEAVAIQENARRQIASKLDEVAKAKSGIYLSSVCTFAMADAILAISPPAERLGTRTALEQIRDADFGPAPHKISMVELLEHVVRLQKIAADALSQQDRP